MPLPFYIAHSTVITCSWYIMWGEIPIQRFYTKDDASRVLDLITNPDAEFRPNRGAVIIPDEKTVTVNCFTWNGKWKYQLSRQFPTKEEAEAYREMYLG